jgi:hypothetical protein
VLLTQKLLICQFFDGLQLLLRDPIFLSNASLTATIVPHWKIVIGLQPIPFR